MSLVLRLVLYLAGAVVLGFTATWAFLAYQNPNMVVDFATALQMCGIPLGR